MKYRLTIILLAILSFSTAGGQEMSVSAPRSVSAGDRFQVRFEVNANSSSFRGPSFKGLSVLSGPSTSSSSSTSFINGKVSHSVSTGYTYVILADQDGTFNIGAASCTVDGKTVSSEPFTIKVEKLSQQQQQQRQQQQRRDPFDPWSNHQQQTTKIDNTTLFARASINKSNLYQGEQAIITYKIYTQVPISQFQIDKLPGNKGFWAEDLSVGKEVKQYEETVNGQRYQVAEIRRGALFAQESGTIRIEPLDLNVLAMVQRQRRRSGTIWDLFDDPFFNSAQAVERKLTTNALNVKVKPLPSPPDGYTGAVGRFEVNGGVNTNSVRANEAVTYRITISGTGNLMLINTPELNLPKVFETYDPEVKDKITKSDNGVSGSRTYEWVLIPRSQGEFKIPAYEFAYFDPSSGRYIIKHVEAQRLNVKAGDPKAMATASSKDDVKMLNRDINYIKLGHYSLKQRQLGDKAVVWFWIAIAAIVGLSLATYAYGRKLQADNRDIAGTRLKQATRMARRRLKKAAVYLKANDNEHFYEEIYKAIWGCIADKYNIELAELNRDTVKQCLQSKNVSPSVQEDIMKLLQDVDMARFAPSDPSAKRQAIFDEALQAIASL
ncbi:MAG: BatD family protein [Bacteroidales bacterium]|nr:BatD family protein [Bacteroidales bacterium]